jgi:hypothetical protein
MDFSTPLPQRFTRVVRRTGFVLLCLTFATFTWADDSNPWRSCVTGIDYESPAGSSAELRILDRHGRDITHAGMPLMDWEGFVANPEFRFSLVPPDQVIYPVNLRITAPGAPRLYLFHFEYAEHPYSARSYQSVHNEDGPLFGVSLSLMDDGQ